VRELNADGGDTGASQQGVDARGDGREWISKKKEFPSEKNHWPVVKRNEHIWLADHLQKQYPSSFS